MEERPPRGEPAGVRRPAAVWTILVADADPGFRERVRRALDGRVIHGRPLRLVEADTASAALEALRDPAGVALVLLGESAQAGPASPEVAGTIRGIVGRLAVHPLLRTVPRGASSGWLCATLQAGLFEGCPPGGAPDADRALVAALSAAIGAHSRETGSHMRRVAEYARLLGELSGLDEDASRLLSLAAPLHDAGKLAIPDEILHKRGRHSAAEQEVMRTHTEYGRAVFADHEAPVLQAAAVVAGEHHERWDGLGYPHGYRGEQIHIFGRITAIADVFDALTHRRCYKEAWSLRQTLQYLVEERGRRFDPALVDLFLEHLDRFVEIHQRFGDADRGTGAAARVH